ncbi:ABC transporter permease [Bosea sp. (in: a-proteobacteria)]|uniref:ABC transporter permease n=1 Tax=Bosea sp. (in: a-proteobacteria) TaxID=1871050 RepID=UPI001AD45395|nr:ABC transporter permease [Bosea sp. (in: a-proteobacteria)]MBN9437939.1 ABC transporter permease [Bosea sp. (in: a-proteobacteria)]MBN9449983.1 ABC transporter permease [Bosea sp. (in: a-proteobacteria)]
MSAETSATTQGRSGQRLSGLRIHLQNIVQLVIKELRSIRADPVMLILLVYSFSIAVYTVATGASTEAKNLSVGIVDEDRSDLSRQIRNALNPPLFKSAVPINAGEIDEEMDHGRLVFVLEIPPSFQADLLSGRRASVQLNVDATAMTQAGNGAVYIQSIIAQEVTNFLAGRETVTSAPVNVVIRAKFNPNLDSAWFTSVMQVINSITLLTVILTGAALIREREQGTVEHLLVMPVVPTEIMLAKIIANGLVILVAAGLSLALVVQWWLQVPIAGSLTLFLAGAGLYVFAVAALGIMLGTLATTMGQFGLLAIPILVLMQLLSGSSTPMESMPVWLQYTMQVISPTPHFVAFAQAVLYRGAGFSVVWLQLVALIVIGGVYFSYALSRFRRVIFGD